MTISAGDYVLKVRTADGASAALKTAPAENGDYCVRGRTADGQAVAMRLDPLDEFGQFGIRARTGDGYPVGLCDVGIDHVACDGCEFRQAYTLTSTLVSSGYDPEPHREFARLHFLAVCNASFIARFRGVPIGATDPPCFFDSAFPTGVDESIYEPTFLGTAMGGTPPNERLYTSWGYSAVAGGGWDAVDEQGRWHVRSCRKIQYAECPAPATLSFREIWTGPSTFGVVRVTKVLETGPAAPNGECEEFLVGGGAANLYSSFGTMFTSATLLGSLPT